MDLTLARAFMATHARILDRRRFLRLLQEGQPSDVLAAVDAYRNDDGGYGWGLEADLRSPESQTGGALHAFETFADMAPVTTRRAVELCDWLNTVALDDGGLPFAFPVREPVGSASFWVDADPSVSSLHITAAVTAEAHRLARHDPAVAAHPWLIRSTEYCLSAIESARGQRHALEVRYTLNFLDLVADSWSEAAALIKRVGAVIPESGCLPVPGGREDELMRPLDFAPRPDGPVRALFSPDVIAAELDRLESLQQADGGWPEEWGAFSPAAALEWRGWLTVRAVSILQANGRAGR
jgi:hypothetical protein